MQFKMKAKITDQEFYKDNYYTCVVTPAPDEYSQPQSFRLRSTKQLGSVGQEVEVICSVSGYLRNRSFFDKQTGQNKTFTESHVYLDVVDRPAMQQRSAS